VAPQKSAQTLWRVLRELKKEGRVRQSGKGRGTVYEAFDATSVRLFLKTPPSKRPVCFYNDAFLDAYIPQKTFYLKEKERQHLNTWGTPVGQLPGVTFAHVVFQRFLIDLSWASSHLEGNTYDLLQTQRLIAYGEEAEGKNRKEAIMILNHKQAIEFVVNNLETLTLSSHDICNIHALLSEGLLMDPRLEGRVRDHPVAIGGSPYHPLAHEACLRDELTVLLKKARMIQDPYEQSFFLLVHIPYLQAFSDVNKRVARLVTNIPLLKASRSPLSFVSLSEEDYLQGLLGVYEKNNVALLKEVYVSAYEASAQHYRVLRQDKDPSLIYVRYRTVMKKIIKACVIQSPLSLLTFLKDKVQEQAIAPCDHEAVVKETYEALDALHEGQLVRYDISVEHFEAFQRHRKKGMMP
jgi:hypothetical protein